MSSQEPPLQNPEQACELANPHSSAYVDIDGDCLPGWLSILWTRIKLIGRSGTSLCYGSIS